VGQLPGQNNHTDNDKDETRIEGSPPSSHKGSPNKDPKSDERKREQGILEQQGSNS